jgi:hypothetical protein
LDIALDATSAAIFSSREISWGSTASGKSFSFLPNRMGRNDQPYGRISANNRPPGDLGELADIAVQSMSFSACARNRADR